MDYYFVANHRSTIIKYESQESIDIKVHVISNYWMETTKGRVKYRKKKVGDDIYIHIFNKFNPKNKENREEVWNHRRTQTKN